MNTSSYRCMSCGGEIIVTEDYRVVDENFIEPTLQITHPGEADAACRLVFEALSDELLAAQIARVTNAVRHIREAMGQ